MNKCPSVARRSFLLAALVGTTGALVFSWAPQPAIAAERMVVAEAFVRSG